MFWFKGKSIGNYLYIFFKALIIRVSCRSGLKKSPGSKQSSRTASRNSVGGTLDKCLTQKLPRTQFTPGLLLVLVLMITYYHYISLLFTTFLGVVK